MSELPPDVTFAGTVSSIARTGYRLVDLSGFDPPARLDVAHRRRGEADVPLRCTSRRIRPRRRRRERFEFTYEPNTAASEDSSAFGPLGFLLLVPLSLGFLVAWARRRTDRVHGALALALPLYVVALALGTRWNLYVDRFLITPAALTLPLAPAVLRRVWVRPPSWSSRPRRSPSRSRTTRSKPRGVWNLSRADAQAIRWPELQPVLEAVQARVPAQRAARRRSRATRLGVPVVGAEARAAARLAAGAVVGRARLGAARLARLGAAAGPLVRTALPVCCAGRCCTAVRFHAVDVTARIVTLELAETFVIARSARDTEDVVQVTLTCSGVRGHGEAAPIDRYDESPESALAYVEEHAGLIGDDPFALEEIMARLPPREFAARAAIDAALHDLQGKLVGRPVYQLLGLPRLGPPTSWTIWLGDPDDMARRAEKVRRPLQAAEAEARRASTASTPNASPQCARSRTFRSRST